MPQIKKTQDVFYMIESFLKMGGSPHTPIVTKFCLDFGIDKDYLIQCIQDQTKWNGLKMRFRVR